MGASQNILYANITVSTGTANMFVAFSVWSEYRGFHKQGTQTQTPKHYDPYVRDLKRDLCFLETLIWLSEETLKDPARP